MNRLIAPLVVATVLLSGAADAEPPAAPGERRAIESLLPELHLLEPIWSAPTVYRESLIFVGETADQAAEGKLLFPAAKILEVQRADGAETFVADRDYRLQPGGRSLVRLPESRIPQLLAADLFPPAGAPRTCRR